MKKSPFFTILTTSLNNGNTIGKTLESVRNQSFKEQEHIVIDGGSHDETLDILKQFDNTYNLTWISESDHGIANALNKGISRARGRYILVIQADDQILTPNVLQTVYSLLEKEVFDIHSFPIIFDQPIRGKVLYRPIRILWWYHFKTILPHQGSFVHRRVYDRIGGFREEFTIALDYDFFYRTLMSGCSVKFEKRPVALMGGQGISSNQDFLITRIQEEARVQYLNETNPFWRLAQLFFRTLYFPYKTRFLPRIRGSF